MQSDLERFLDAADLAELVAARTAITVVDDGDGRALHDLVASWRDEQAVVNLLMFPELLPDDDRTPALAEALSGVHGDYAVLAATVGLAGWVAGDDDAPAIAERLLALVADGATPAAVAARASVALGVYAEHVAPTDLLAVLCHEDAVVRHNVLGAALSGWGGVETLDALDALVAAGALAADAVGPVRRAVVDSGLAGVDDPVRDGPLVEPLVTRIPDLTEWETTTATA